MDGRIQKFLSEQSLLEQAFIKDTSKTVATLIKEATATVGEKISIRRFERYTATAPLYCFGQHVTGLVQHCSKFDMHSFDIDAEGMRVKLAAVWNEACDVSTMLMLIIAAASPAHLRDIASHSAILFYVPG